MEDVYEKEPNVFVTSYVHQHDVWVFFIIISHKHWDLSQWVPAKFNFLFRKHLMYVLGDVTAVVVERLRNLTNYREVTKNGGGALLRWPIVSTRIGLIAINNKVIG